MSVTLIQADARHIPLADESVNCCVTSPPYWGLRDYGVAGQLGLERTPEEYISNMVQVFREVKRVLRKDGTLWLNMGDSYCNGTSTVRPASKNGAVGGWSGEANQIARNGTPSGYKTKDLMGIPWMLALALRADGWYLRMDIIWHKPNPMPESVTDRPTKAHEYIFLLSKGERYYYNAEAIKDPVTGESHARAKKGYKHAFASQFRGSPTDKRHINGKVIPGVGPKGAGAGSGIRYNESFSAAITELVPERNKRSVWSVPVQPFNEAHFATFPEELIKPCILAGCPTGGMVLDPFMGSGTTALVARNLNCSAVGLELNPEYLAIARRRLRQEVLEFVS